MGECELFIPAAATRTLAFTDDDDDDASNTAYLAAAAAPKPSSIKIFLMQL